MEYSLKLNFLKYFLFHFILLDKNYEDLKQMSKEDRGLFKKFNLGKSQTHLHSYWNFNHLLSTTATSNDINLISNTWYFFIHD